MFRLTNRTGVHSPDEPAATEIVVRLHPSVLAKGWGHEPDTRAAIEWLEQHVQPGMTVADIGTGTGILAIVAMRLGADVTAYEANGAVSTVAGRNFLLNHFALDLRGVYDGANGFDFVVANLGNVDYAGMGILDAGREVWTSGEAT